MNMIPPPNGNGAAQKKHVTSSNNSKHHRYVSVTSTLHFRDPSHNQSPLSPPTTTTTDAIRASVVVKGYFFLFTFCKCARLTFIYFSFLSRFHERAYEQLYARSPTTTCWPPHNTTTN